MQVKQLRIIFKDKRNSSGVVKDGEIVLYISSRLPKAEQTRHIDVLTARLTAKLEGAQRLAQQTARGGPPAGLTPTTVTSDEQLEQWAKVINAQFYGFNMGKVRFRKQESRWGSCSGRTRNLQISRKLQGGPHDLLEYVLIHEIAHLGEFNHSHRFWALVARACPDYKERRGLLKQYEAYLRSLPPEAQP